MTAQANYQPGSFYSTGNKFLRCPQPLSCISENRIEYGIRGNLGPNHVKYEFISGKINTTMSKKEIISQKITALFVYGRPPLVFAGLICAVAVIWTQSPILYTIGVSLLFISMSFDLVDGWFAARFELHPRLEQLAATFEMGPPAPGQVVKVNWP